MEEQLFYSWLAGFIDGDGCFTLSLTTTRTRNPSIIIAPQVRIAIKGNDSEYLYYVQERCNLGKIYWSNKRKENAICSWQTTNLSDTIKITKQVLPYLIIKKDKAKRFLEIVKFWESTKNVVCGKRNQGKRLRTKEQIIKIVKVALNLNYDRQVKRYRDKKGWDYWESKINELYG